MRLALLFACFCACFVHVHAQSSGDYRTIQSGSWADVNTWQRFNGTIWVAAPVVPSSSAGAITIQPGHSVTVQTGSETADQLLIEGELVVSAGATFSLAHAAGTDLTLSASGVLIINGTFIRHNLSTISNPVGPAAILINPGAVFRHNYEASLGLMPAATWSESSTLEISSLNNAGSISANASWDQSYGNIIYNCPLQTGLVDFAGQIKTVRGDLIVRSTGTSILQFSSSQTYTLTVGDLVSNVGGDVVIQGTARVNFSTTGNLNLVIYGTLDFTSKHVDATYLTISGQAVMSVYEDFVIHTTAHGKFRLVGGGTTGNATINLFGDLTLISGRLEEVGTSKAQATIRFLGSQQSFRNTGTMFGLLNYYVAPGSTVDLGAYPLVGQGTFSLGGTIIVGSPATAGAIALSTSVGNIRTATTKREFLSGSAIIYRGDSRLFMGDGHPSNGGVNTIIDNPAGVELASDVALGGNLSLQEGELDLAAFHLTASGTFNRVNGEFAGSSMSSFSIIGSGAGNWGDLVFAANADTLGNLSVNRTGLNASVTVPGSLWITSSLTLQRGALVNLGTLGMANGSTIVRYSSGTLSNSAPGVDGTYNVSYRTNTPSGGPYASFSPGLELPSNATDLGSFTISLNQNLDILTLNSDVLANGSVALLRGTLTAGVYNIIVRGTTYTHNSPATLTHSSGYVVFGGDSTAIDGSDPRFVNVGIEAGANAYFTRNFSVSGNIDFAPGAGFSMDSFTMTLDGSLSHTISANGAVFANINISKTASQTVTLTSPLSLTGVLAFPPPSSGVILQSSGFLTLLSSSDQGGAQNTASITRLINDNSITGNVIVQRHITGEGRIYRFISAPTTNATVADLKDDALVQGNFSDPSPTTVICGVRAYSTNSTLFWYDETIPGAMGSGYTAYPLPGMTSAASPLVAGRGYSIYVRRCDTPTVFDFTGPINQGTIDLPVTFTNSDPSADGWNLVGNPYPSGIDWNHPGWTKLRMSNSFAITDNGSGMTRVYDPGVTEDVPNGFIASGQGFWVRATGANPILTIRETVKIAAVPEYYRTGLRIPSILVSLSDGHDVDKAYIKTVENASANYDSLDIPKIINPSFSLSTLTTDRKLMAINALPSLQCGQISLQTDGLKPGSYSISLDPRGFFNHLRFYIRDRFTHERHAVFPGEFRFEVSDDSLSASPDRFYIEIEEGSQPDEFGITAPSTLCEGTGMLILTGAEKGAQYELSINGNHVKEVEGIDTLHVPLAAELLSDGENVISITAIKGCSTREKIVTIQKPESTEGPVLTLEGRFLTTNSTGQFEWFLDGEAIGESGNKIEVTSGGLYELMATNDGCVSSSFYLVEDHNKSDGVSVYPNPTEGDAIVTGLDSEVDYLEVINLAGQSIFQVAQPFGKFDGKIRLTSVPDGLYLLIVKKGERSYSYRLLKRSK